MLPFIEASRLFLIYCNFLSLNRNLLPERRLNKLYTRVPACRDVLIIESNPNLQLNGLLVSLVSKFPSSQLVLRTDPPSMGKG